MLDSVSVTVPATTANIGPGFDCIGAALTLYNQFHFSRLDSGAVEALKISVSGTEAHRVARNESNLAYQAFVKLYQHLGQVPPPIHLAIALDVPLARGLGSSATAIVGGLMGANGLAGTPLSRDEVVQLAIAMEGHPDNVVPALLGGCQLSVSHADGHWCICDLAWQSDLVPIVAIPNFELSTAQARRVLPSDYSRGDAIFNMAHVGLLVRALATGRADWLQTALHDRIHQPYRQTLIPGYESVRTAALDAGAYGVVISGAGPTLLALAHLTQAFAVTEAMVNAWKLHEIEAQAQILHVDLDGAKAIAA